MRASQADEKGSLLLMALILLITFSVLVTAITNMASLEYRMNDMALKDQQAQQMADAGVDWAMENIYQILLAHGDPLNPASWINGMQMNMAGLTGAGFSIILHPEDIETNGDYYIYGFTSNGYFGGVTKKARIKVQYDLPLEQNRGVVTYYRIYYQ
ncbi:MAG: hypothetical protein ACOX0E_07690 [Syntrophomonadaceae bacterium]